MLGRPVEDLIGKTMDDLFPSDLAKSMIRMIKGVLREGKPIEVEEEIQWTILTTTKFPLVREENPSSGRLYHGYYPTGNYPKWQILENIRKLQQLLQQHHPGYLFDD